MATFDTPDYIIGNSATIQAQLSSVLSTLDQALQALQPAPNATTVQFNDTLLLDNGSGNTITAGSNQIDFVSSALNPSVISNSSGQDMNIVSSADLNLTSTTNIGIFSTGDTNMSSTVGGLNVMNASTIINSTGNTSIQAGGSMLFNTVNDITMTVGNINANLTNGINLNAGGEITFDTVGGSITSTPSNNFVVSAGNNITLTAGAGMGIIDLEAFNVNSFGYALPICFTRPRTDAFTYSMGGQNFEMVYQTNCQIPQQFISNAPTAGYTSTIWKIEFALNCFNFSNPTDKGIGIYIDFIDTASNVYTPVTYNATTPYSADQKTFGFNSNAGNPYFPINYTDYVDFAGLVGTFTTNFPLDVRINFAADAGLTSNFNLLITLTRTNLI